MPMARTLIRKFLASKSGGVAFLAAVFLIFMASIFGSANSSSYQADELLDVDYLAQTDDVVSLGYSITSIEPNDGLLQVIATPKLKGEYGEVLGSGSFVQTKLDFVFDAYTGQSFWQRDVSEIAGGMQVKVKLDGDQRNYPFDTYKSELIATAIDSSYENPTETGLYVQDEKELVPGFAITSEIFAASLPKDTPRADQLETIGLEQEIGISGVRWLVSRSFDTILTVGLLALLILLGAVVSVLITLSIIRGKRPPSMNALSWLAALLFAMFSVRTQLPGSPPNGILFDLWLFYPVVLLLVMLIAVTVISWVVRDDWDVANPVSAVLGKRIDNS